MHIKFLIHKVNARIVVLMNNTHAIMINKSKITAIFKILRDWNINKKAFSKRNHHLDLKL